MRRCTADWQGNNVFSSSLSLSLSLFYIDICFCLCRYINHSCDPNCVAEVVQIDKEKKIIIISKRFIKKGEEVFLSALHLLYSGGREGKALFFF